MTDLEAAIARLDYCAHNPSQLATCSDLRVLLSAYDQAVQERAESYQRGRGDEAVDRQKMVINPLVARAEAASAERDQAAEGESLRACERDAAEADCARLRDTLAFAIRATADWRAEAEEVLGMDHPGERILAVLRAAEEYADGVDEPGFTLRSAKLLRSVDAWRKPMGEPRVGPERLAEMIRDIDRPHAGWTIYGDVALDLCDARERIRALEAERGRLLEASDCVAMIQQDVSALLGREVAPMFIPEAVAQLRQERDEARQDHAHAEMDWSSELNKLRQERDALREALRECIEHSKDAPTDMLVDGRTYFARLSDRVSDTCRRALAAQPTPEQEKP